MKGTLCLLLTAIVAVANGQRTGMTGPCGLTAVRAQMAKITTPCRAPGGRTYLSSCTQRCANSFQPFWKNVSHCAANTIAHRIVANPTISKLAASCKTVGSINHAQHNTSGSCSTTALYPFMIQCASFTQMALKDGKLDSSDHFCTSTCYKLSQRFNGCKSRASVAFQRSISALAASDKTCAAAATGKPQEAKIVTKIKSTCASQTATALTKGACRGSCFRTVRWGMANNFTTQIKALPTYKRLANLVNYCNSNRTNSECKSSKNMVLNQVMSTCCGKKAKNCAAGHLPKNCTSRCSGAYLPFYSQCGRTVFKGKQLRSMVGFARTCARQNGRFVSKGTLSPTANLNGPNPKDACSHIKNCTQCAGKCGWCRNEVQNKKTLRAQHGGWCSSVCVTSNGECRGRTGFSHRTRSPMTGEVGKQCFDGINNGGVGGTDCQDCGCLAQFRSYCTRKIKSAGQTMPSCKKGSGSGSGKGGKGSGKGSGAAMMG